jgi:hypothetical protein
MNDVTKRNVGIGLFSAGVIFCLTSLVMWLFAVWATSGRDASNWGYTGIITALPGLVLAFVGACLIWP